MISQYLLLESLLLLFYMIMSSSFMCAVFMQLQKDQTASMTYLNRGKRLVLLRLMVTSIGLATVLFFAFPRSTFTLFRNSNITQNHPWTDYSEELRPGSITNLIQTDNIIFRARFDATAPAMPDMYWHGSTLAVSDGFNWSRKNNLVFSSYLPKDNPGFYRFEADMEDSGKGALFLLSPSTNFKLLSLGHVAWRGLGDARIIPLTKKKTRWTSSSVAMQGFFDNAKSLDEARQIPSDIKDFIKERYPQFEGLSAAQIISNTSKMFSAEFGYSLNPGAYSGTPLDQLQEFLINRKVGVCEHFASAQALILRAFGFPSVINVGFHGGEYNDIGDYWIIRGRDAHAWVNYYDESKGWQRSDPTYSLVPSLIDNGATDFNQKWLEQNLSNNNWMSNYKIPFLNSFIKIIDTTYYNLNLAFINFDAERQQEIWNFLGLEEWKRSRLRWLTLFIAGVSLSLFWLANQRFTRSPWQKVNSLYRKYLKKLHKIDLRVDQTMPPLQLKTELIRHNLDESYMTFLDHYIDVKYGTNLKNPTKQQLTSLKTVYRRIRNTKGRP